MHRSAEYFAAVAASEKLLLEDINRLSAIEREQQKTDTTTAPMWEFGARAHEAEQRHNERLAALAEKFGIQTMGTRQ